MEPERCDTADFCDAPDADRFVPALCDLLDRSEATLRDLDFLELFDTADREPPLLLDSAEAERERALETSEPDLDRELRLPSLDVFLN